jgi:hypothetical protein
MDAATVATFAVWGALLGAMAEVVARFVLLKVSPAQGSTFHLNPVAFAVGPLVNLPVFAIVTVFAWLTARALRPRRAFEAVVFAVLTLVAFETALITERVHLAALAAPRRRLRHRRDAIHEPFPATRTPVGAREHRGHDTRRRVRRSHPARPPGGCREASPGRIAGSAAWCA